MKHLLLFTLLLLTTNCFAQNNFGVFGGVNYSNLHIKTVGFDKDDLNLDDYRYKLGFTLGAKIETHFSDKVLGDFSIAFQNKGSNIKSRYDNSESKFQLYNAEISASAGFKINEKFTILTGISVNYLVHAKSSNNKNLIKYWEDVGFDYRRFDVGPKLNLQYEISNNIQLSLGYYHGLISLFDPEIQTTDDTGNIIGVGKVKLLNRSFELKVAYIFKK